MATDPDVPTVVERAAQPYVAIRRSVTMGSIATVADRLPDVFGWLAAQHIAPADAPFFKYDVIDMAGTMVVEVGMPVPAPMTGEGEFVAGVLPAGRYATVTHVGHPDQLADVTRDLLAWAAEQGLRFDVRTTPEGEAWGCRLESYRTDPAVEPDMSTWKTTLLFRLAD
jgi:effector-binding domain-containing protein